MRLFILPIGPEWVNFCRVHQTLKTTPAVAAGVTDHVWKLHEIMGLLEQDEAGFPTKRGPYKKRQAAQATITAVLYPRRMASNREATRQAEEVIRSVWPGSLPIDPYYIAHRLGIRVVEAELSPNISGAIVKRVGEDPQILLNARDSPNRKRFTCAHEIGHYIRRSNNPEQYEYVDLRDGLASKGANEEEIFANAFAASLLMPGDLVRSYATHPAWGASVALLASRFEVSQEAMAYRLDERTIRAV